ncbi:hypothetical protein LTR99_006315 [Exophiala xenobiotica]|uniref:PHD-type domain-containing protein n=1 Tax=Vermiconidia calcicola TaxID=1690605 RepID=A0AAV9QAA0_9PEZI|nr:hypothetical protein LTR96_009584 [Exophiala xenobiotica]KAK5537485.1 hypothetical protein LTR25_004737 [Vermiconidia calcicola]KAK5539273.1 hypothetical protein LTR23_006689 [Chaetothyriales sp. CCFEE 6169]KAK5301348.1 hypothetical protein LTR99_006315 [Exophiala xenobiotica]KAK5333936.1 hypothetical protein LTR98_009847 [Exophiala xenobiotica]
MATRSLRHRSSRYSSPATFGEKDDNPKPVEAPVARHRQQSSLDAWIEPPVRPAVPSFEDTKGLERVGVLENMQPLGVSPSQRLLQKLKLNYARPSPRPTPVQPEDVLPTAMEPEKMDAISSQEPEILSDYPSEPPLQEDTVVISSPPRGRPPRKEVAEMSQAVDVSPSAAKLSLTPSNYISPKPPSIQEHLRRDRLQNHVERAVNEAQERGSADLVPGLERLREDAQSMPDLWNVLEAVVQQSPNAAQFKIFKRYIKSGVKKHRRASQISASPYQSSPLRHDDLTSPRSLKSAQPDLNAKAPSQPSNPRISLYFNRPRPPVPYEPEDSTISPSTTPRNMDLIDPALRPAPLPTTSPNKRKRTRSVSSDSSLSSARSIPDDFGPLLDRDRLGGGSGRSRSANQRQATNRATAGNRLRSAATSTHHQSAGKLRVPESSTAAKVASKKVKKTYVEPEFDLDELSQRKSDFLIDTFHDYNTIPRPESNERELVHGHPELVDFGERPPPPVIHPNRLPTSNANLSSPVSAQAPPDTILINVAGRKRIYDEIDTDEIDTATSISSSPGPFLVPPPPPGVANAASRGATPRATRFPALQKGIRKSARVMVSPNKPKNGGITAGISRAGPSRDAAVGNGADSGAELDNDEYCASCGGEGKLLCCDGCTNSFHHACLEPPLDADQEVDGEWFCPRCVAKRSRSTTKPTGLLGSLIRRVDDTIPKAFALPHDVREYFEGVKTGEEGEYEDVGLPRTQNNAVKMNRAGFIEEPNYKETRDSKGNLILCYSCGHTSNGRDIIPCDFCPAKWHLDCLDPPLAVPPRRRADWKPTSSWRCPLHVEQDLTAIGRQAEAAPGDMGRVPRLRKPKNAVPLDVPLPRGFRNNGIIEVELMKDEFDVDKTREFNMEGKIYRVPEKGIRLDFIDRVKKSWYEDQTLHRILGGPKRIRNQKYRPENAVLHHPPHETVVMIPESDFWTGANALAITETAKANAALRNRSLKEQQTVLSLAEMSQKGINGYSGDALAELTNELVSEAPPEVVEAVEQTELERLLSLQELITRRLEVLRRATPAPAASEAQSPAQKGREPFSKDKDITFDGLNGLVNGGPYVNKELPNGPTDGTANREEDDADNEMELSP